MRASFQNLLEAVSTVPIANVDNNMATFFLKYDKSFWDTFAQVANHEPQMLSSLLGVRQNEIMTWHGKIKSVEQKAERLKSEKIKQQMIPTGSGDNNEKE